jgi:hypothetical protein
MNNPVHNNLTKLVAFGLLAAAANVPASGVSAAEPPVKATCSAPDHSAALKAANDPQYPAIAKAEGISGSTLVRVSLKATGAVEKASQFSTMKRSRARARPPTIRKPSLAGRSPARTSSTSPSQTRPHRRSEFVSSQTRRRSKRLLATAIVSRAATRPSA